LAPRYSHYQSFCATAGLEGEDSLPQCYSIWVNPELALRELAKEQQESMNKSNNTDPKQLDFGFEGPEQAECFAWELQEDPPSKVKTEFLHYHQCFGHILSKCIQEMAHQGILLAHLATCPIPVYHMPLWQGHQETLAIKALSTGTSRQEDHHHARCSGLSGYDDKLNTQVGHSNDWQAYPPVLSTHSSLC